MRTQSTLLLNGRQVAWAEFGDPEGIPVLACHGTPGTRLTYAADEGWATWASLRLIVPDRPGWGRSQYRPWQAHTEWAGDVVAIMERVSVGDFAVLAASGGGVFGLAIAAALPDRVLQVALTAPGGPYPTRADMRQFGWRGRLGLTPAGLKARHIVNSSLMRFVYKDLGLTIPADVPTGVTQADLNAEYIAQRLSAYLEENRLGRNWSFPLEAITCPVRCWSGDKDPLAPARLIQNLEGRIKHLRMDLVPGGHFAPYKEQEHIYRWLKYGDDRGAPVT